MWKKIVLVIAIILLVTGIGFLLFPPVSNYVGQVKADAEIKQFEKEVDSVVDSVTTEDGEEATCLEEAVRLGLVDVDGFPVDGVKIDQKTGKKTYGNEIIYQSDLDRLREDSLAYNKSLLKGQGTVDLADYSRSVFYLPDYGFRSEIYGYISIDAIDMRLPVYLGARGGNMRFGAAHMYGTSLPVGDESSNCAIAGHTNYTGRIFFDRLRELVVGDTVTIHTRWDSRDYKVTSYKTIKPDHTDDLLIQDGKQLLTLITCIRTEPGKPYDRYLVICERVK